MAKLLGEAGLGFARAAMALATARATSGDPAEYAKATWPSNPSVAAGLRTKGAVAGGTIGGWGDDSVWSEITNDFLSAIRPLTILDRAPFRRAPLKTAIPRETTAATTGSWASGGQPIAVSAHAFETEVLEGYRAGAISVLARELLQSTRPGAERAVRDILVASLVRFLDRQLLDPDVTLVAGQVPASITNGATEITSTGATAAQKIADLQNMIAAIGSDMESPLFVMTRRDAVALATTLTTGGSYAFPNVTSRGGQLLGIEVMISASAPSAAGSPATDRIITLVDCAQILVAEGAADVVTSSATMLEMSDTPTADAAAGTGASIVSMFQTESSAIKTTREVSWLRTRTDAVAYMQISW